MDSSFLVHHLDSTLWMHRFSAPFGLHLYGSPFYAPHLFVHLFASFLVHLFFGKKVHKIVHLDFLRKHSEKNPGFALFSNLIHISKKMINTSINDFNTVYEVQMKLKSNILSKYTSNDFNLNKISY